MSIQSSFTQPLSLIGMLATQHPLIKKGVAVGETKKIINASQKTFDNMYYKSVVGASVDMTPSDLEKERELARVASKDYVEAKQKLAELQPTEKHKMEAIASAQIMGSEMSDIEDHIDASLERIETGELAKSRFTPNTREEREDYARMEKEDSGSWMEKAEKAYHSMSDRQSQIRFQKYARAMGIDNAARKAYAANYGEDIRKLFPYGGAR